MSMNPAGVAVFGCGAAGQLHAYAVKRSSSARLVAVVDVNRDTAQRLGAAAECKWTTGLDEVLSDPQVDIVSIAVPHDRHYELASASIAAGKHVILEKPFTLDPKDGWALVRAAHSRSVLLAPWLERRYLPIAGVARETIASGALGKIAHVRISSLGYKPSAYWEYGMSLDGPSSSWRRFLERSGGGVLIMNAIHQIDLMHFITALEVESVFARSATVHHQVEVEDSAIVTLVFDNGGLGVVEASCAAYGGFRFPIDVPQDIVSGANGTLALGEPLRLNSRYHGTRSIDVAHDNILGAKVRLLDDFVLAARGQGTMRCSAEDAIRALTIVKTAYESARLGRPLTLSEAMERNRSVPPGRISSKGESVGPRP
jgi:UDP-N-acetyl-2-amino-2-deoxyglucuronate dehydrogenase